MLLGLSMDVIYQFKALDRFYPAEAADDGDPARRHSLFHLPVDRRADRASGGSHAKGHGT